MAVAVNHVNTKLVIAVAFALVLASVGAGSAAAEAGTSADATPPWTDESSPDCLIDWSGPYLFPCWACDWMPGPPFKDCW